MTRATTTPGTMTIGIDLKGRKSHICVLDADGQVIEESQTATKSKALRARFEGLVPACIALEVGGHSAWMSEVNHIHGALKSFGQRVKKYPAPALP